MLKGHLYINDDVLPTLLAVSNEEQTAGLMFVEPPTPIMSFVYRTAQVNKFWMKATPSELDIVFSINGKITNICKGEPHSTKLIGDDFPSDLVVELPYGTCAKLNVNVGDSIGLVKNVDKLHQLHEIKNNLLKDF